jgi:two-component system sensor histidine kinase KdpD
MQGWSGEDGDVASGANAQPNGKRLPWTVQYGSSLALVAAATFLAFLVDQFIAAPNLTLVFVLPVVIAASAFGWGPALVAALAGVLAFDFFFTHPFYSFAITNPSDIWAAGLLLATGAIVSAVAGEARRRAVQAQRAARQSQALHALAHSIVHESAADQVLAAAAEALSRIFEAPTAIFIGEKEGLRLAATAGGATVASADTAAAITALQGGIRTRGEAYPTEQTEFDFWPFSGRSGVNYVLGVDFAHSQLDRPSEPERFIEIVEAYLATSWRNGRQGRAVPAN